jgi:hypothetical protein
MGGRVLALDTILSATFYFVRKWNPDLSRSASRDLLRFVILRLYDEGRGNLQTAHFTLAQGTLAHKLGLSRQWVGILLARLQEAGWVTYSSSVLAEGMRSSTVFRVGRQLQRLVIMLLKSRAHKTPTKSDAKRAWQFSPSKEVKKILLLREKENQPLPPDVFTKIPLLRTWMERGKEKQTPLSCPADSAQ